MFVAKINLPAASALLTPISGCVLGWSIKDTTVSSGSAFDLWDGSGVASQYLATFTTNANESFRDDYQKHHLPIKAGLYFSLLSGTIVGQVTVLLDHDCDAFHAHDVDILAGSVNVVDLAFGQ